MAELSDRTLGREAQTRGRIRASKQLAEGLAAELHNSRDWGQPLIYEQTFRTGKVRVTVIWDARNGMPLQRRTATIPRAYEIAEGPEARDRMRFATGEEAVAARAAPGAALTAG